MDDKILIKSGDLGDKTAMPNLTPDELGYVKDKEELHIGTKNGNVRLCGAKDVALLNARIDEIDKVIDEIKARLGEAETPSE